LNGCITLVNTNSLIIFLSFRWTRAGTSSLWHARHWCGRLATEYCLPTLRSTKQADHLVLAIRSLIGSGTTFTSFAICYGNMPSAGWRILWVDWFHRTAIVLHWTCRQRELASALTYLLQSFGLASM
jgi:hypothetical protein